MEPAAFREDRPGPRGPEPRGPEPRGPEPHGPLTVSVVIPTRNRPRSLARALRALSRQTRPPDEVVVVDASDRPSGEEALRRKHAGLSLTVLTSEPGVCAQRNAGIRRAVGSHVLLLDDDIEAPPDYLEHLTGHLEAHPSEGAVTGLLREPDADGVFREGFEVPSFRHLLFAFVFQLTVWGDVEATRGGPLTALPLALLRLWYRHRDNTWSLAGWPLVTRVRSPVVRTAVYGLGAALVRRDWLLASPYDERLGTHGIGDNYGVALGFPGERPITVLRDVPVLHHRAPDNRLDPAETYFRRVLALDYFLGTDPRFSGLNLVFLAWSLKGNAIRFALRGERALFGRTVRALALVAGGRNPLLRGTMDEAATRDGNHR